MHTPPPPRPQLAHPYYIFTSHGYSVTIASIKGGEIPVDEASLAAPFLTPEVEKFLLDGAWGGVTTVWLLVVCTGAGRSPLTRCPT